MTKITFELSSELNSKFRKAITQRKGLYRGAIQDSIVESIELWLKTKNLHKQSKINKKTSNLNNKMKSKMKPEKNL
ncbi:MAG: hypothetical protein ACPKPY_00260 [Nitrososphaeraceae archaeon]